MASTDGAAPAATGEHTEAAGSGGLPQFDASTWPGQIAWFEAPNAHFTSDIDTPQDAARLLTLSSQ